MILVSTRDSGRPRLADCHYHLNMSCSAALDIGRLLTNKGSSTIEQARCCAGKTSTCNRHVDGLSSSGSGCLLVLLMLVVPCYRGSASLVLIEGRRRSLSYWDIALFFTVAVVPWSVCSSHHVAGVCGFLRPITERISVQLRRRVVDMGFVSQPPWDCFICFPAPPNSCSKGLRACRL